MKKLFFHIGSDKCGSTLIQRLFSDSMVEIFRQIEIGLPFEIYHEIGARTPVQEFAEDAWREVRARWFAPLKNLRAYKGFYVTQENLFGVTVEKGAKNTCSVSAQLASFLAEGFDTTVLIVFRRQDGYIESLYNQRIKRGETRDFATFLADLPLENLKWDVVCDTYARYFGEENILVVPFESRVLKTAGHDHFVEGIASAIGLANKLDISNVQPVNPSLSPRVLEIQRLANQVLTKQEAEELADWFTHKISKPVDDPHAMLTDVERQRLIDYFAASNARLFDKYLGRYDGSFYLG